jgi:hypothetical protein
VKRLVGALAGGAAVFAVVFALAASLNLSSDTLGAGTAVVAACQAGAVNATYTSAYSASLPGYYVSSVVLTGLTAPCYNLPYRVTMSGAANASLGEVTGTTPGSGATITVTFPVPPAAGSASSALVTGVSVVISTH